MADSLDKAVFLFIPSSMAFAKSYLDTPSTKPSPLGTAWRMPLSLPCTTLSMHFTKNAQDVGIEYSLDVTPTETCALSVVAVYFFMQFFKNLCINDLQLLVEYIHDVLRIA